MSAREWKPGDVALVEVGCHANRTVAIRTGVPSNMGWAYCGSHHGKSSNNWSSDTSGIVTPVRPLVVIDPEDTEQVERLWRTWTTLAPDHRLAQDNMQAALREFANPTPPKPPEPQGLGAVVEDVEGADWHRTRDGRWIAEDGLRSRAAGWGHIDAVRVLSEGVPA